MPALRHDYPFDPAYGYGLAELLAIEPPPERDGFVSFWRERYRNSLKLDPCPRVRPASYARADMSVLDLEYRSTDGFHIHGWLLEPRAGPPQRGFVVGHGYGGIAEPDFALPFRDAAYLIPCFRGLGRSRHPPISEDPQWHVLHDIHLRDRYILGGCVEDLWLGVSALLALHPQLEGRLAYLGTSFGGGIGALALPWEPRLARGHLNVPSFGHQTLRLRLPTAGSASAVQAFARTHGHVAETLAYYDAAIAARYIRQPMHLSAALFDPVVAPPGQFAIYNALPEPKWLFVLTAGHFEHPRKAAEEQRLRADVREFFGADEPRIPPLAQLTPES